MIRSTLSSVVLMACSRAIISSSNKHVLKAIQFSFRRLLTILFNIKRSLHIVLKILNFRVFDNNILYFKVK